MVADKQPRLLGVDNEVVVPVNKSDPRPGHRRRRHPFLCGAGVRHQDRRHPGRLNETWFKATKEGMFYGQCSELCGKDHAFMPIAVRVVNDQEFATWIEQAKKKYAAAGTNTYASAGAAAR